MFRTPSTLFRTLAIAEAISWTGLIAALVARAVVGESPAVTIAGAIHGFVFLSYGATAVLVALNNRWRVGPAVVAVASAIVPYATIPTELWLARSGRLAGVWRTEPALDRVDARWYDAPLRWFLRHPWVLGALILLAVAAIYVVLLLIGPPGGR
ncbi:DUF3817 domain-containing protein [Protaetiibacter mangrovi]|uniref:DUF3817 domain-containing protein n=1 Tax=Protaetiibacter mangrovi TaxID=2970926 RepID=A0ABT1ZDS3_9MICO|nr:DUF3817 domain-containing protein [Protaetiibacter mangrovi]MCS0498853.1 DUF3817 domain-containing protein [Protaetiibacter mangrovi]TPX05115.1 DUF3817 domain-containing protein [Schumannella luteola]